MVRPNLGLWTEWRTSHSYLNIHYYPYIIPFHIRVSCQWEGSEKFKCELQSLSPFGGQSSPHLQDLAILTYWLYTLGTTFSEWNTIGARLFPLSPTKVQNRQK